MDQSTHTHTLLDKSLEFGFKKEEWRGNSKADQLATAGTVKHHESAKDLRDYEYKKKLTLETQRYLLDKVCWLTQKTRRIK